MISKFFLNMASRLRNENDLSDITWAMCESSKSFNSEFVRFFFDDIDADNIYLEREKTNDDCRPDFFFECGEKTYLIECKIGDRKNHHFNQYVRRFNIEPKQLGYITNYYHIEEGFTVHTWTELYQYLEKRMPSNEERELWKGYLDYLKNVCNIYIPTKPMRLEGMYSLYTFYQKLDEVFTCDEEKYKTSLYDSKKDTKGGGNIYGTPRDGVMGKYFEVKFKGKKKSAWGWMGIYFSTEEPLICMGFRNEDGWGKPVFDKLYPVLDEYPDGKYGTCPYEEDGAVWFNFKKNSLFDKKDDVDKQVELLRLFFKESMEVVCSAVLNK